MVTVRPVAGQVYPYRRVIGPAVGRHRWCGLPQEGQSAYCRSLSSPTPLGYVPRPSRAHPTRATGLYGHFLERAVGRHGHPVSGESRSADGPVVGEAPRLSCGVRRPSRVE